VIGRSQCLTFVFVLFISGFSLVACESVLSRLRGISQHVKAPVFKDKWAWTLAEQIVCADAGTGTWLSGEINQAMMELGATYCAPSGTGIDENDPLKAYYYSTRLGREFLRVVVEGKKQGGSDQGNDSGDRISLASLQSGRSGMTLGGDGCPICGTHGMSQAVDNLFLAFSEAALCPETTTSDEEQASKCGHSVFPLPPPKIVKKEEVFAVGSISCSSSEGETMWLLVRRPETGLLAGQWEFPAALVWTSDGKSEKGDSKKKSKKIGSSSQCEVPKIIAPSARKRALDELLEAISQVSGEEGLEHFHPSIVNGSKRMSIGDGPVEHVFTHVRHTMWIEHASLSSCDLKIPVNEDFPIQWLDGKQREVRWMRESDMDVVGVTSGVLKILNAVKRHQTQYSSAPTANPSLAKRRRK